MGSLTHNGASRWWHNCGWTVVRVYVRSTMGNCKTTARSWWNEVPKEKRMSARRLGALLCAFVFFSGCGGSPMKYTLYLADRHIRVLGFDPSTGQMTTEPAYSPNGVYMVLARVTDVAVKNPGNSGLSGWVSYRLLVQTAPVSSPYKTKDIFFVTGAPDGTTAWATNGVIAEVVFLHASNKFVDFKMQPATK
jgi:hypothetical protein